MTILDLQVELSQTNKLLERIAVALERLAGPPLPDHALRQSDLSDLTLCSPEELERIQEAENLIATDLLAIPGSTAFYTKLQQYEELVRSEQGELAVSQLPWNQRKNF